MTDAGASPAGSGTAAEGSTVGAGGPGSGAVGRVSGGVIGFKYPEFLFLHENAVLLVYRGSGPWKSLDMVFFLPHVPWFSLAAKAFRANALISKGTMGHKHT